MKAINNITGIILAGGKSSRMGTDKGFISYQNKPFTAAIIQALEPIVTNIILVSNHSKYDIFKYTRVPDLVENSGPVAGIYTGLEFSKTTYNLVLSCDVPLVKTDLLQRLVQEIETGYDVVQFTSQGKTTPLIALYNKHCSEHFKKELEEGEKRLLKVLDKLNVKTLTVHAEDEVYLKNINTPNELKEISHVINY